MVEDEKLDLSAKEWDQLVDPTALEQLGRLAHARVWRVEDGTGLPYDLLDNDHLVNILLFLRRKAQETAQCAASRRSLLLGPSGWRLRPHPQWDGLLEEARRRGPQMATIADLLDSDKHVNEEVIRAGIPRP